MTRQRWPTSWLLTDERMGDGLQGAIRRAVEAEAGILLRHHQSTLGERRAHGRWICDQGAVLAVSRDAWLALELGAELVHDPEGSVPPDMPFSLPVHDEREADVAAASEARFVFISPVFPTRSHPGAEALGEERALALLQRARRPGIALGGMNRERGEALIARGYAGWAGIDCWLRT